MSERGFNPFRETTHREAASSFEANDAGAVIAISAADGQATFLKGFAQQQEARGMGCDRGRLRKSVKGLER